MPQTTEQLQTVTLTETTATTAGHWPPIDEDGFLLDSHSWSESFAEATAAAEGIPALQASHWGVINFLRDYYQRLGGMPSMRRVCRSQQIDQDQANQLFNGCLSAWRIAGLPNPGEEYKAYHN